MNGNADQSLSKAEKWSRGKDQGEERQVEKADNY